MTILQNYGKAHVVGKYSLLFAVKKYGDYKPNYFGFVSNVSNSISFLFNIPGYCSQCSEWRKLAATKNLNRP